MNVFTSFITTVAIGMLAPLCASAGTLYNQNLAALEPGSGVYYGSGNVDGGWTVGSQSGIEIGLRAKLRFPGATDGVLHSDTDHYWVPLGVGAGANSNKAMWNFDWSINAVSSGSYGLSGFTATMTITDMNDPLHPSVSIDPFSYWPDNAGFGYYDDGTGLGIVHNGGVLAGLGRLTTVPASPGLRIWGAQNSDNPKFNPNLFLGFNPYQGSAEYKIQLDVFASGSQVAMASDSILVESAPEPASLLLMIGGGLVLVGVYRRRKVS